MKSALAEKEDPYSELRNAAERLLTRRAVFGSQTLADFVRFANAISGDVNVKSTISEYCRAVRKVSTANDCPPQARRMLDAITGSLLAWRPGDTFGHIMGAVVFRRCFFTFRDAPAVYHTTASFFSHDTLEMMRVKADRSTDGFDPNRFLMKFLSSPRTEDDIATETLRASYEVSESQDSNGFEVLFGTDDSSIQIWTALGGRLYGDAPAEESKWMAIKSFLTGDWDRARGLVAILCFLLYHNQITRRADSDVDVDSESDVEVMVERPPIDRRPVPDIFGWAEANPDKIKIVKGSGE